MRSFKTNSIEGGNPFNQHISDEQFKHILNSGFEVGSLDSYSHLTGGNCYTKYLQASNGWDITIYITEEGIAVDYDYECGGNCSATEWWYDNGEYTRREYKSDYSVEEDVSYHKFAHAFEEAWDKMMNQVGNYTN